MAAEVWVPRLHGWCSRRRGGRVILHLGSADRGQQMILPASALARPRLPGKFEIPSSYLAVCSLVVRC